MNDLPSFLPLLYRNTHLIALFGEVIDKAPLPFIENKNECNQRKINYQGLLTTCPELSFWQGNGNGKVKIQWWLCKTGKPVILL